MRIHTIIFNWKGYFEAALQLENVARSFSHKVTVINSDPHHTSEGWVDLGDDAYFGEQFATACELFDGDVMFHIQADAKYDNWADLVTSALETFSTYECGVYAPQVDRYGAVPNDLPAATAALSPPPASDQLRVVSLTDCTTWFINSSVIRQLVWYAPLMRLNRFGFGIDILAAALAFSQKQLVFRDDRHIVNHPDGTGYSRQEASIQMEQFIKSLPPEIYRRVVKLRSHTRISRSQLESSALPSLPQMAKSFGKSLAAFANSGFTVTDPETLNARLETCRGCEFWDESGFVKTGRCKKCGCSTQAKLRMATEKCPIGKW